MLQAASFYLLKFAKEKNGRQGAHTEVVMASWAKLRPVKEMAAAKTTKTPRKQG